MSKDNYKAIEKLFLEHNKNYSSRIELRDFFYFELSFNYDYIGGISYQWCVPPPVMDILKEKFQVQTELFASPLNHFYSKFYSLFEMDKIFGGLGNSLNIEELKEGGYECNPPFIEDIMEKNSKMIVKNLQRASENN